MLLLSTAHESGWPSGAKDTVLSRAHSKGTCEEMSLETIESYIYVHH